MSPEAPVQTVLACAHCGKSLPQSDLVQIAGSWVCADCKPAFLSRVMASGATPNAWRYGGFWIRLGAWFIDGLVLGVPFLVLFMLFMPSFVRASQANPANPFAAFAAAGFLTIFLIAFLVGCAYEVVMLKYRAATLGRMACGLKVVRTDGRPLSWGLCVGRFFMRNVVTSGIPYLNSILLLVSGIMVGTDTEKRALHDRVCDTRVIYSK